MVWMYFYLAMTPFSSAAMFVAAEWIREPGFPAPDRQGLLALVAGLLWPVLATGAAQLGLLVLVRTGRSPIRWLHTMRRVR